MFNNKMKTIMKKKTYQNPDIKVVSIETTQMLAGSLNGSLGSTPVGGNQALAPGFDFVDDVE